MQSSTCLNRISAELSSGEISEAVLPGTEMLMYCEPCCWTVVPFTPRLLKRVSRIEIAWFMLFLLGMPPLSELACNVTCVPPCRSRPSPILNFECQSPGRVIVDPMMTASMTIRSAASAARCTPGRYGGPLCRDVLPPPGQALPRGRDGLLGGVTCPCPFVALDSGALAAYSPQRVGQLSRCGPWHPRPRTWRSRP